MVKPTKNGYKFVGFYLTPSLIDRVKQACSEQYLSFSCFIRQAALVALREHEKEF
jgi:hypothetical protein